MRRSHSSYDKDLAKGLETLQSITPVRRPFHIPAAQLPSHPTDVTPQPGRQPLPSLVVTHWHQNIYPPHPRRPDHATSLSPRNLTAQRAPQPRPWEPSRHLLALCLFTGRAWTVPRFGSSARFSAKVCVNCDSGKRGAGRIVLRRRGSGRELLGESFGFSFCLVASWNGAKTAGEGVAAGASSRTLAHSLIFLRGIFWCSGAYHDFRCAFFVNLPEFEEILSRSSLRICLGGNLGKENGSSE